MKNVSASKMNKPSPPAGTKPMPRVGGHTSNTTPTQGVPTSKGGC